MSETNRPKAIIERDLKSCTIQLVGKRSARNPDTYKPESAFFSMVGTFSIENNKRFREFSLIKIIRAFRFSWQKEFGVKTVIFLTDGEITFKLDVTENQEFGVNFEMTNPVRISTKEAVDLISKGARVVELDPNSDSIFKGEGLPIARFGK
jgi:hypothetical protein